MLHASVASLFERKSLTFIAGPCVIEGRDHVLRHGDKLAEIALKEKIPLVFKASFDKANRTSVSGFRGPGLEEGLRHLEDVKRATGLPLLTDVHEVAQCAPVASVVDVLQIPAFLCRQTDLVAAAAQTGRPVNVKKGQFVAPEDMRYAVEKCREVGGTHVALTERGTTFGYRDLVVDLRGLVAMRALGVPVVFDATHSVQKPSGAGGKSGGNRLLAGPLARGALAVGVDGVFAEVHEDPDNAKSDGPNQLTFVLFQRLIRQCVALHALRATFGDDPQ
jgi:2-dehydro-3-deoxyphosphooctonate aldolase (KDO 8-P synthase)